MTFTTHARRAAAVGVTAHHDLTTKLSSIEYRSEPYTTPLIILDFQQNIPQDGHDIPVKEVEKGFPDVILLYPICPSLSWPITDGWSIYPTSRYRRLIHDCQLEPFTHSSG